MATATELENLVVRLSGDAAQYEQMLKKSQASTNAAAANVKSAGKKIENISSSLTGFAASATSALAALGGAAWLGRSLSAFGQQQDAEMELRASMEASGNASEALFRRYLAQASAIQDVTTVGDELSISLLAQAEQYGLTGESALRATRNAIAAARGNGEAAASFIRKTAALEQGDTMTLMEVLPSSIRRITNEAERAAAAQAYFARQFDVVKAKASTVTGQLKQLWGIVGDLNELFGKDLGDLIGPLVSGAKAAVKWLQQMPGWMKQAVVLSVALVTGLLALGPILTGVGAVLAVITGLLTPMGIVIGAIGSLFFVWIQRMGGFSAAWAKVQAKAMQFWEWIKPTAMGVLELLKQGWETLTNEVNAVWNFAQQKISAFVAWATPLWNTFMDVLKSSWTVFSTAGVMAWNLIGNKIQAFIDLIQPRVKAFVDRITFFWTSFRDKVLNAWDVIKAKIQEWIAWVRPIVFAAIGMISAAWDLVVDSALAAWDWISESAITAWNWITETLQPAIDTIMEAFDRVSEFVRGVFGSIMGDSEITWSSIRDFIVDSFLMGEFVLRNFGDVAAFVWTGAKLKVVEFVNEVSHFFTSTLPALLGWFSRNFPEVFQTAVSFVVSVFENMGRNVGRLFTRMGSSLASFLRNPLGGISFDVEGLFTPLTQGFENTIREMPQIPRREMGATERALREEFERQGSALNQSWEEFRRRRLAEIDQEEFPVPTLPRPQVEEAVRNAEVAGRQIGTALNREFGKAAGRFDAVLADSAEALSRIAEFQDRTQGVLTSSAPPTGGANSGASGGNQASGNVPRFQTGGVMESEGLAYLHANETIFTAEQMRVLNRALTPQAVGEQTGMPQSPVVNINVESATQLATEQRGLLERILSAAVAVSEQIGSLGRGLMSQGNQAEMIQESRVINNNNESVTEQVVNNIDESVTRQVTNIYNEVAETVMRAAPVANVRAESESAADYGDATNQNRTLILLKSIADSLLAMRRKPSITIEEADLG